MPLTLFYEEEMRTVELTRYYILMIRGVEHSYIAVQSLRKRARADYTEHLVPQTFT